MSYDCDQFRMIIRSTLQLTKNLWSPAAEELLLGTAAHESHLGTYLHQIKGPALGPFGMEPATEQDIWKNYLHFRPHRIDEIMFICGVVMPSDSALGADLRYQILMARLHYRRIKAPLPHADDLSGQAEYWDKHYNRNPTKGFPPQYIADYLRLVRPER